MSHVSIIAVVDDDEAIREAMEELLESFGYKGVPFKSAIEFLKCIDRSNFDCILSDIKMPGMDGIQMLSALNKDASRPPIVFMTSFGDPRIRAAAMRGGAAAFLGKPVEADQLIKCLENAVVSSSR